METPLKSPLVNKAASFAAVHHSAVNHKYDSRPYTVHLEMVASFAEKFIYIIPECHRDRVLAACWLHDTIEDCRLTYNDIKNSFGSEIAEIVYALTNDKGRNRQERAGRKYYIGICETPYASFVKVCDRLANIKYSSTTSSKMLNVYKKECDSFMVSLFSPELKPMFDEMIAMVYSNPLQELTIKNTL